MQKIISSMQGRNLAYILTNIEDVHSAYLESVGILSRL